MAHTAHPAAPLASRIGHGLVVVVPLAFLGVMFLVPILYMGVLSLEGGEGRGMGAAYAELAADPVYLRVLLRTFGTAALVALLSVLTAYPLAWMLVRLKGVLRRVAFWCVLFPLWMSALTRTFSWMILLDRGGPLARAIGSVGLTDGAPQLLYISFAVYLGMLHIMIPYAVFPIYSSLLRLDGRLLQASEGLGATPLTTFLRVQFPLTLPGISAAGTLVFLVSLGFFVTPAMLGGLQNTTVASLIETLIHERFSSTLAAALAMVLLGVTLLVVLAGARLLKGASPVGGPK